MTDFSTLSKGSLTAAKPRAALRQVLFSQSEKTPATEVLYHPPLSAASIDHINTSHLPLARLTHHSGSRSAGLAEAGSRNLCGASRPEVDLEWRESWNDLRKELDRHCGFTFGTSCTCHRVNVVYTRLLTSWVVAFYLLVLFSDHVKDAQAPAGGAVGVCPHWARLHQQASSH